MSAAIFSGNFIKLLKDNLKFKTDVDILTGTVDPSTTATSAAIGSLYLNSSTGKLYSKQDAGSTTNWLSLNNSSITKELTGFETQADHTISYDPTTQTVTVTPTGTTFNVWVQGRKFAKTTETKQHANVTGTYWIEYNSAGVLTSTASLTPDFENKAQVKYCIYDTTQTPTGFGIIEDHGIVMDWATHKRLHVDPGTVRVSGGALTSATYVIKLPSDTYNAANSPLIDIQPGVDLTVVLDEDLQTTLAAMLQATGYTTMRYDYANLKWLWTTAQTAPYYRATNVPQYNPASGGANLVNVTNNAYYCTYLVASPMGSSANSQLFRYMWTPGRTQYIPTSGTTANRLIALNNALAEDPSSIDLSTRLSTEYVIIGKVVCSYNTGSTGNDYRLRIEGYQQIAGSRSRSVTVSGVTGLSAVNTDDTLTGTGTVANVLSTTPIVDVNGVYNGKILPNTAYKSVADGYSTNLTFGSDGAMTFSVIYDGSVGMLCNTCFGCPFVSVFSDPMNVYLPTDAGTGIYIGKGSGSYVVTVKNRTGSSQNIIIQSINSNITNATTWA